MSEPARVVVSEAQWVATAAQWIAEKLRSTVAQRGRCGLALAGGETPRPVYAALAEAPWASEVPWPQIEVFFSDERAVSAEHPDSNLRMARAALLSRVPIPEGQIHPMFADAEDAEAEAERYARALPDALDVLLLGMGADGHTASLFPQSPAVSEGRRKVTPTRAPQPPHPRMTLTPVAIAAARHLAVLVRGAAKAAMVARALDAGARCDEVPARLARHGTWILDAAAASALRGE
ncbi:MAG TPA: 6-phosphogluconolactonase [Myxococcota bacterium]